MFRYGPGAARCGIPLERQHYRPKEDSSVIKTILASSVLATGLLLTGASQPAHAVWVCGPVQCVWDPLPHPGYVVPGYAAAWTAPLYTGCVWRRGFFGRWRMICP